MQDLLNWSPVKIWGKSIHVNTLPKIAILASILRQKKRPCSRTAALADPAAFIFGTPA